MGYDLERYLHIDRAYGASFDPSGARLSFLMDTTGVPQVWTLDGPGRWPRQATFGEERVTFARWSPERTELAFGRDAGGDERAQLFLLRADDGVVTPLTDRPDAKHRWGGWSSDGERLAFASNRRDPSAFDVYVQKRGDGPGGAELVHEGDGWLTLGGFSPDDRHLLLVESRSSFDQRLAVLDLETGERIELTPDDEGVRYWSTSWGPDGEALYVATDRGTDTTYLGRLAVPSGELEIVESGGRWNVEGVTVHEETGRIAYLRNVDGYAELTVGTLRDGTSIGGTARPSLPGSVAGGARFDRAGERLAIATSGARRTTNVVVVDLEAAMDDVGGAVVGSEGDVRAGDVGGNRPGAIGGGEPDGDRADDGRSTAARTWTRASTAGIPRDRFVAPELVRYETFDGREIPAFLSMPREEVAAGNGDADAVGKGDGEGKGEGEGEGKGAPAIVDVHGGPESQRRPSFDGVKQFFLDRGYVYFEPNVRGSTGYGRAYTHLDDVEGRMDAVADLDAGVRWLGDREGVDPDRIVAMGGSYGGFMVLAALTTYPERWAAGVSIVGIANFITFLQNTGDWRRSLREAEYGSLENDRDLLASISPINTIERIRAPLFVLHGENDPRVPVEEAEQVARAASKHVPVETLIFPDEGHGITRRENRIEAYTRIAAFLEEYV